MTFLRNFWNDEQGQDLIEYTLLMAFVALASAALFLGAGGSIKGIWSDDQQPARRCQHFGQLVLLGACRRRYRSSPACPGNCSLTGRAPQRVKKSAKTRRRVAAELPDKDDRDR